MYAAWDDHLKRTVAIKRINPKGLDDAALTNPWSEAIRLAAIRHANIVTVYDMGQEDDFPYIVMEHVQGEAVHTTTSLITPSVEAPMVDAHTGRIAQTGSVSGAHPGAAPILQPATVNLSAPKHTESISAVQLQAFREAGSRTSIFSSVLKAAAFLALLVLVGVAGYYFNDLCTVWKAGKAALAAANESAAEKRTAASSVPRIPAAGSASVPAATPLPHTQGASAPTVPTAMVGTSTKPAPAAVVPVPHSVPAPVPPTEVIFRVAGSNTIGAKLLPGLMAEFLKSQGATKIERKPGKTADDVTIEAIMNGEQTPKAISIEAHGSATAFEGLLAGKCDLGMASRPVKVEEAAAIAGAGLGDLHSPALEQVLGLDGIAILISKENRVTSLTKQEIAGIFSGEINDWKQVGGKPGPIHVFARDAKAGTFDTFKTLVLDKLVLAAGAKRFEDSRELSDAVAADPEAIGFAGLPFIRNTTAIAVSEPGASPLMPTRFTVATEDYLLSRRLYLYVTTKSQNNPMTAKFLEFVLSDEGQAIVNELGFVRQTPELEKVTPPAGAPEHYVQIAGEASRMSLNLRFRTSSKQLDNKAQRDIERIVSLLEQPRIKGKSLLLLGFADGSGAPKVNEKLSRERAEIVAKEFAIRGITPSEVTGFGSVLPVASNENEPGRDRNRRVEVWIK